MHTRRRITDFGATFLINFKTGRKATDKIFIRRNNNIGYNTEKYYLRIIILIDRIELLFQNKDFASRVSVYSDR